MPKVFEWNGYRFHFFANEGDPREPVHIHVSRAGAKAKFWLFPEVSVAYNRGFPPHVLSGLVTLIENRRSLIESAWNDYFA